MGLKARLTEINIKIDNHVQFQRLWDMISNKRPFNLLVFSVVTFTKMHLRYCSDRPNLLSYLFQKVTFAPDSNVVDLLDRFMAKAALFFKVRYTILDPISWILKIH